MPINNGESYLTKLQTINTFSIRSSFWLIFYQLSPSNYKSSPISNVFSSRVVLEEYPTFAGPKKVMELNDSIANLNF